MQKKISYFLFFLMAFIFIIITAKGLFIAQPGDENTYYYMGKLVSEGKIPYKDFFYAHPPLHIYFLALIYYFAGFNILSFKIFPLLFTLITSFFVFKMAEEKLGEIPALLSCVLFLFSYSIIFNSVFSFGIELAAMLLVIGFYFLWNKKYSISGFFFALAALTRLLALVPIMLFIIFLFFSNKKNFIKLSSAFFAIFLFMNIIFMISSPNYFNQVYKFHLLKSFGGEVNFKEYSDVIKLNWILFLSAFSFIFIKNKKQLQFIAISALIYLIFLASLKKLFGFYFIIVFPFLALLGGYSITELLNSGLHRKYKIAISIIIILLFLWNFSSDVLFLQKIGFSGFERGEDMKNFLNSRNEQLLFGDDSVTPLLALMTGKRIVMNFVDTNDQVFASGLIDLKKTLASVEGKDLIFILRSRQGISLFEEVRAFVEDCNLISNFHDNMEGDYVFYSCQKIT